MVAAISDMCEKFSTTLCTRAFKRNILTMEARKATPTAIAQEQRAFDVLFERLYDTTLPQM